MGQNLTTHFTKSQQTFLDLIAQEPFICDSFYLTGGTALSACYLNHRLSEDIDLFSQKPFVGEKVIAIMAKIVKKLKATSEFSRVEDLYRYDLGLEAGGKLKVDFSWYDFIPLEPPNNFGPLAVDSLTDIAVNKLLSISQRTASKDYVDLYFILKQWTVWDLRHGVEHKFKLELEPLYLSSLFTKVSDLSELPIMKKKLTLEELKAFFLKEAKRLAAPMIKP